MIAAGTRRVRGLRAAAVALALGSVAPAAAPAQWEVEAAAGGVSHEAAGGAASRSSAMLGIRHVGTTWVYLTAGIPLGGDALAWAAAGAGSRLARSVRVLDFGLDLGAQAHGYRVPPTDEPGGGLVLDALPFVGLDAGTVRVELRSGIAHYSSRFSGETISRTLHESGVLAEIRPHPRLSLSADGRLLRAEEDDYPYLGAAAELAMPRASFWARAGGWAADALPDPSWGVGTVIRVAGRYSLRASFQQEATDPLFWNETRRFWSVGASRRLGGGRPDRLIAPVLPRMSGGGVVFAIPAAGHDAPPSVAGDFNGWTPVPMTRAGDEWVIAIPVPPGIHHYAFRAADGGWFVPDTIENRVDDGFGGTNAVLVVPPPDGR